VSGILNKGRVSESQKYSWDILQVLLKCTHQLTSFKQLKNKDLPAAEAGSAARSAEDLKATGAEGYLQGLGKDKKMNLVDK
jgi:hypothetical protein